MGERINAEPVQDLKVVLRLPSKSLEGMPALARQRRALPEVQRLAVHRCHQAPGRGKLLSSERPPHIADDQSVRSFFGLSTQLVGTAAAAENRLGGAHHQAAAGQYVQEAPDLVRTCAQVIDSDNGADLAEQLPAILRGGLDRQVALIEPGHQILEQIPTRSPAARR